LFTSFFSSTTVLFLFKFLSSSFFFLVGPVKFNGGGIGIPPFIGTEGIFGAFLFVLLE